MFCPKCGTKNIDEAKFCGACGTPLDANAGMPAPRAANAFAPAPQVARVQPSAAPGGKNALPLLIAGAAASFIAVVLVAVFVVAPAFNKNPFGGAQVGDVVESDSYDRSDGTSNGENPFKGVRVGDVVEFGSYEQDGDASNGKEPIEWRVLAVEGNRAYVVSQKALDARAFNTDADDGNDWNSSELKKWLENDFASQAFTDDEMKEINGAPTLLSVDEANNYFKSDNDRICMSTQQAASNGALTGECWWWLRSPGDSSDNAVYVDEDGRVRSVGFYVDDWSFAVRPALWVNL